MAKRLFDNLKLLVLSSAEFEDELLTEVQTVLVENKAQYDLRSIHDPMTKEDYIKAEYTHIISNTIYFKLYNFAQENLIPVVNSDFVFKTVEKGNHPGVRPFSPDPNSVLRKVHVCVGGLPDSDKEAIYGGVRALGGSYSETLNKFVTHLISMDPDEDCCIAVNSIKDFDIKIVLPHWIDDCLKTRKKLDETPYLLKQSIPTEEIIAKVKEFDLVEKDYDKVQPQKKFLKDKVFFIGSDLELSENYSELIKQLISNSGGKISETIEDAKYYVGKFRDGDEYLSASRSGKYVGNIHWVFWMIEYQKWIAPHMKLLHYPFVRGGLPEMKDFVISSTNYSGDARYYIMKLIEALGAKFTPSLTPENTHLIAATSKGKKYTYSLRWNLKVINHLWLEETYQKWKLQPENHPRYSHYPRSVTLDDIIGETSLDLEVLKSFYEPEYSEVATTHFVEDSDGDAASQLLPTQPEIFETVPSALPTQTQTQIPLVSNQQEILPREDTPDLAKDLESFPVIQESTRTPSLEDKVIIDAENELSEPTEQQNKPKETEDVTSEAPVKSKKSSKKVSSAPKPLSDIPNNTLRAGSGRKAKDKAAAKLHEDMEQLNYFQKQQKSKDVPLLPDEIEERKRKRETEKLEKELKKSRTEEEHLSRESTIEPEVPGFNINAIATGWEVEFSRSDILLLSNLGIKIYKDFNADINTIISPKLMRTEKFLVGLSYRLEHIISPLFLKYALESYKLHPNDPSQLPEVETYSLEKTNRKSVKELTDIPLSTLLRRCQERLDSNSKLFKGLTFNITPRVPGGVPTITKILKAHGADAIHVLKTLKDFKDVKSLKKSGKDKKSIIFLTSEKGFIEKTKEILNDNPEIHGKVIEWDWVVQSIFHMENDHGKNIVFQT